MNTIDEKANPPAFPCKGVGCWVRPVDKSEPAQAVFVDYPGMTLRDYFAAAALQRIIANPEGLGGQWKQASIDAFKAADEMLKVRQV